MLRAIKWFASWILKQIDDEFAKQGANSPYPVNNPTVAGGMTNLFWSYEILADDGRNVLSTLNILDTILVHKHVELIERSPNEDPILHLLEFDVDVEKMEVRFSVRDQIKKYKQRKSLFNNRQRSRFNNQPNSQQTNNQKK